MRQGKEVDFIPSPIDPTAGLGVQLEVVDLEGDQRPDVVAASKQGSPTVRRTLTEPPLEYRQPAPTAATDELGEDEYKKQRRLKRQAQGGGSWRDLVPWL